MPSANSIPGVQLIPLSLQVPGFFGVNTELAGNILPKEWATRLNNAVFDETGRASSRKGWNSLTTSAGTGTVMRIFEYYKADGTSEVIYSTDSDIYRDTTTATSIEGTLGVTDGNIKFVNFNDKVVAFGIGTAGIPAVRTTGNFADITVNSGTAPSGKIGTSAFGRLWAVDTDGKTIRYSALLDETRWATADGGGSIDMSQVWPAGQDNIVAIEELGGNLVVMGSNNTVIWTDGGATALGVEPSDLYVSDTIPGVGAVSQFAIARVLGDLWVLTDTGVISLSRELVQRSTPLSNISRNVQSEVISDLQAHTNADDLTMAYSPKESLVILVFPSTGRCFAFDTRFPLEDASFRTTTWTGDLQTLTYIRDSQDFYGSLTTAAGEVMQYTGSDDNGTSFQFDYESGWLDLGAELNTVLKFVKRMTSFVFVEQNVVISHTVDYDFGSREFVIQRAVSGGRVSEYGTAEYGTNGKYNVNDPDAVAGTDIAEYSGGIRLRTVDAPGKGGGQYIRIGVSLDTSSGEFSLQQINLYAKVGRLAT